MLTIQKTCNSFINNVSQKYIVLGMENVLLSDEGVEVKVIQDLKAQYNFPEGVELVDGGVESFSLLSYIESAKMLLL